MIAAKYGGKRPKHVPADSPEIGQLFDISQDRYEQKDVWEQHPEVVRSLRRQLARIKGLVEDDPREW